MSAQDRLSAGDSYALALSSIETTPSLRREALLRNCKDLQQFERLARYQAEVDVV